MNRTKFKDESIAEALYVINKQAKVYREQRDYCFQYGKEKNQQAKIDKGHRFNKMKEELYDLKNKVLNILLKKEKAHIVGFHRNDTGYLIYIRFNQISFHQKCDETTIRRIFSYHDIPDLTNVSEYRGMIDGKIPSTRKKHSNNFIKIAMKLSDAKDLLNMFVESHTINS